MVRRRCQTIECSAVDEPGSNNCGFQSLRKREELESPLPTTVPSSAPTREAASPPWWLRRDKLTRNHMTETMTCLVRYIAVDKAELLRLIRLLSFQSLTSLFLFTLPFLFLRPSSSFVSLPILSSSPLSHSSALYYPPKPFILPLSLFFFSCGFDNNIIAPKSSSQRAKAKQHERERDTQV